MNIMIEVELFKSMFEGMLGQIYYFQSASAILAYRNGNQYVYYSAVPPTLILDEMETYSNRGFHRVSHPIVVDN